MLSNVQQKSVYVVHYHLINYKNSIMLCIRLNTQQKSSITHATGVFLSQKHPIKSTGCFCYIKMLGLRERNVDFCHQFALIRLNKFAVKIFCIARTSLVDIFFAIRQPLKDRRLLQAPQSKAPLQYGLQYKLRPLKSFSHSLLDDPFSILFPKILRMLRNLNFPVFAIFLTH